MAERSRKRLPFCSKGEGFNLEIVNRNCSSDYYLLDVVRESGKSVSGPHVLAFRTEHSVGNSYVITNYRNTCKDCGIKTESIQELHNRMRRMSSLRLPLCIGKDDFRLHVMEFDGRISFNVCDCGGKLLSSAHLLSVVKEDGGGYRIYKDSSILRTSGLLLNECRECFIE